MAYGRGTLGAVVPPPGVNGGAQLLGPATGQNLDHLKVYTLDYVRNQIVPPPDIVGETTCLACSENQFVRVGVHLVGLKDKSVVCRSDWARCSNHPSVEFCMASTSKIY